MKIIGMGRLLATISVGLILGGSAVAQEKLPELRIGTDGGYLPWTGTTPTGDLIGFEIDLAKLVCERMQRTCRFTSQPWEGLIPALEQGKYDILVNGISITPEREKRLAFTQSYANLPINFAAKRTAGLNGKTSWPELKEALSGKILGVQSGTQSQKFMDNELKGKVTLRLYDNQDSLNLDLLSGRIDAALAGRSPWIALTRSSQGQPIEILSPNLDFQQFNYLGVGAGGLMRKDQGDLKAKWDRQLCALKAEGEVKRISEKWFGFDVSTPADPKICGA
ncbi:transporter substrate-binding domain-containing protein [Microvirga alba]|uniref:Transporter substrate-binding domain-containing protein n=1 Tax=Microvirga alba TaxID=2791025 RepID=A0A931BTR5_9HYPH|nr:transporter substrate-binding domain-containing protein [Microvirga alba]MBF9234599.1 transporter substrate-binding domain-containing protein [Microvirga alba]